MLRVVPLSEETRPTAGASAADVLRRERQAASRDDLTESRLAGCTEQETRRRASCPSAPDTLTGGAVGGRLHALVGRLSR